MSVQSPAATGKPIEQSPSSTRYGKAALIMMAAIFASRVLGLVRDAVISGKFGQGRDTDIYNAAFMIPDLLFFLIAGGALSSAFIPVFTEKITLGKEEEAWHVFSVVATTMVLIVTVFIILGEIFTVPLTRLMNYGFDLDQVKETAVLTRIVLPAQICFFLGGLMMGAQYANKRFLYPALGPVVYNLGIIVGGVALASRSGVAGLCWGAVAGAIAGNLGLQIYGARKVGMRFKPSLDVRDPGAVRVWKLMLPVILGVALPQVSLLINRMFASELDHGAQSALANANRIMQAPLGIFAQAMAVAIFPTLSALAAEKRYDELRSTASGGIRNILFLTIPASVLMITLAQPIIQVLLQHGHFKWHDTTITSSALIFYSIGIFAWSAQAVLGRGFYALQDTRTPVIIGTAVTVVFIPLNWLFMKPLGMGFSGLALATTIAAALHMVVMYLVLRTKLGGLESGKVLSSVTKIVVASGIAGLASWGVLRVLPNIHDGADGVVKTLAFQNLLIGGGAGIGAYAVASKLLRIPELSQAVSLLQRRKR
jgi:putative peptidoglycan lipid II flippase